MNEFAGSEGIDKIFSPERFGTSTSGSAASAGLSSSSNLNGENPRLSVESTVASLEESVLESKAKCDALINDLDGLGSSRHLAAVGELTRKLENMQILLTQLRTQI